MVNHKGWLYQVLLHLRLKDLCIGQYHLTGLSECSDDQYLGLLQAQLQQCMPRPAVSCWAAQRGSEQHVSIESAQGLIWPSQLPPLLCSLQAADVLEGAHH